MKKYLFILLALLILIPSPVYAIADPDSPPTVNAVVVYQYDDGSIGVLVDYYLDYGTAPTETVTEAYLVVFIDTDGTTQIKSVSPYTYHNNGYGRGLAYIPFTASEVITYGITSASVADYRIWLTGNPTVESGWTGDPPKTIATIDEWRTTGDMSVWLALQVLYYADLLELDWLVDLIEQTSIGNRLTSGGEEYFTNVIPDLRTLAPACFSSRTQEITDEGIDYSTGFSATVNGTILAGGSPQTLAEGANNLNVSGAGTLTFTLGQGTSGNVTGAVVTGTPLDLVFGANNATITGAGAIVVTLELADTTTGIDDAIIGTGWDLTALGAIFGMSRWMISGIVWMLLTVAICAAVYARSPQGIGNAGASKIIVPLFFLCIAAGTLLGLLKPLVGILMFIGFAGFFIGYIIFFRSASV